MRLFAIYFDILGFGSESIEATAKKIHLTPGEVREKWQEKIKTTLKKAKERDVITSFQVVTLDSWVAFTEESYNVYSMLSFLSNIKLPFEIALHFDDFSDNNPTLSNEMMSFLKEDIFTLYRSRFKKENNESSIKETFILATHSILLNMRLRS